MSEIVAINAIQLRFTTQVQKLRIVVREKTQGPQSSFFVVYSHP